MTTGTAVQLEEIVSTPALSNSLGDNPAYLVTVTRGASSAPGQAAGANSVTANAMAKLNIEIRNHWVNVLEALGLSGGGAAGAVGTALSAAQIFSGSYFLPPVFTSQVWRGSSGVEIALQMRFDAWDDPVKDVIAPVQRLIQMFLPSRSNNGGAQGEIESAIGAAASALTGGSSGGNLFLHPPGPTPYEYVKDGAADKLFTVSLGQAMNIGGLIPTTIEWVFEERFDASGNPMAAMMTVGFMSFVTPSAEDILAMFTQQMQGLQF